MSVNLTLLIALLVGGGVVCGVIVWRRILGEVRRLTVHAAELDATNRELSRLKQHFIPRAADWTVADRDMMASLLDSEFGRKLITRLQATEYVLAVANAQDRENAAHSAGVTTGYNHCLRQILSLSQSARVAAEKPDSGAEHGDPQPIEREALEYEARMSP